MTGVRASPMPFLFQTLAYRNILLTCDIDPFGLFVFFILRTIGATLLRKDLGTRSQLHTNRKIATEAGLLDIATFPVMHLP